MRNTEPIVQQQTDIKKKKGMLVRETRNDGQFKQKAEEINKGKIELAVGEIDERIEGFQKVESHVSIRCRIQEQPVRYIYILTYKKSINKNMNLELKPGKIDFHNFNLISEYYRVNVC